MSKTFCGNLPAMSVTLRRRRNPAPQSPDRTLDGPASRPLLRAAERLFVAAALCLGLGCDADPPRDPVPNPTPPPAEAAEPAPTNDDDAAEQYLKIKAQVAATPNFAKSAAFDLARSQLETIANGAAAGPLRANAAVLLGSLYDARGNPRKAAGYYRHAATLVPDDAGPHMVLAAALASAGDLPKAIEAQAKAAELDPDNLENWLALGELRIRSGDQDGAVSAYVSYELRRKGLIDGLTLHDEQGTYVVGVDERVGCANALAAAADQGTAVALIYALHSDPEPKVRAAIARVMGLHRIDYYGPLLRAQAEKERDPDVLEAVQWALAEIARDPVAVEATERPRLPSDDPRATEAELPRAQTAPVAPTEQSTLAPKPSP